MPIKTNEMVSNSAGYGRALEGPVLIDDMRIFGSTAYAAPDVSKGPRPACIHNAGRNGAH